jgi:hypothetical protein
MNTYKIRKYSHKINISIKNNDFNKINIYNDKIQKYSSLIGGSDEKAKMDLIGEKSVELKPVEPKHDVAVVAAAAAAVDDEAVVTAAVVQDTENNKYIDCIKISTAKDKYKKEQFKKEFMKLHSTNKKIKDSFQDYIPILQQIYQYILENKDKIEIKVDIEHTTVADKAKRVICYHRFGNEQYIPDKKNSLSIVDFGGAQGIFLSALCRKLNTTCCTVIESKKSGFVYNEKLKRDNVQINYWDDSKFNDIIDSSVDFCCAIQVLHHLSDDIINTVLTEFNRILKLNDGFVYLIEHDYNDKLKANIDSDHHLYYIMNDQIRLIKEEKLTSIHECIEKFYEYIFNYKSNYKSVNDWNELMKKHGFTLVKMQEKYRFNQYNGKYYSLYNKTRNL